MEWNLGLSESEPPVDSLCGFLQAVLWFLYYCFVRRHIVCQPCLSSGQYFDYIRP